MNITDIQKAPEQKAVKDPEMEMLKDINVSPKKEEAQFLEVDPEAPFLIEMKELEDDIHNTFRAAVKDKNTTEERIKTIYAMITSYEKFLICRKNTYFTDKAKFRIS